MEIGRPSVENVTLGLRLRVTVSTSGSSYFHVPLTTVRHLSRVCAVAQYAVLEASAKVNGRGPFSHPTPPKALNRFRCHVRELMCKIWLESIRPLRICACVKKTRFVWIFLINISIRLSVYPFLLCGYRSQFWGDFYA